MTTYDRTRIYCCFKACPMCGARRGEYCRGKNGKVSKTGYHYKRSPFVPSRQKFWSPEERRRFKNLKCQVVHQGPIPDHE